MIWHFVEVWLMVVLTFVVGCLGGAHLYGYVAGTRLATAQGAVADFIGDGIDRIKAGVGLAPTWRPAHLRQVDRPVAAAPPSSPAREEPIVPVALPPPVAAVEVEPSASGFQIAAARVGNLVRRRRPAPAALLPPAPPRPPPPAAAMPTIIPMRPAGIASPRGGVPDNLQRIKGIGRRNERLLNELGIFHFGQIAAWTPAEIEWIGDYLAFPERISRDDWVGQATLLAMGSETGFQKSAERRRERRRQQRDFQERMATASSGYDAMEAGGAIAEHFVDGEEGLDAADPSDEENADIDDEAAGMDEIGLDEPLTGNRHARREDQER